MSKRRNFDAIKLRVIVILSRERNEINPYKTFNNFRSSRESTYRA